MQYKRKSGLAVFSQLSLVMMGQKDFLDRKHLTNYISYITHQWTVDETLPESRPDVVGRP